MNSLARISILTITLFFVAGCGSLQFALPGHSAPAHTAPIALAVGEHRLALATPKRMPVPGGFALALASEDPAIVSVERVEGAFGSAEYTLVAHKVGTVAVRYVNRFTFDHEAPVDADDLALLRAASLTTFAVTVN